MRAIAIRAHFDGDKIVLDEPYDLEPDARLIVTVLPEDAVDSDREDWGNLALSALQSAYGEDEPEYTENMIKEFNPEYKRG